MQGYSNDLNQRIGCAWLATDAAPVPLIHMPLPHPCRKESVVSQTLQALDFSAPRSKKVCQSQRSVAVMVALWMFGGTDTL